MIPTSHYRCVIPGRGVTQVTPAGAQSAGLLFNDGRGSDVPGPFPSPFNMTLKLV